MLGPPAQKPDPVPGGSITTVAGPLVNAWQMRSMRVTAQSIRTPAARELKAGQRRGASDEGTRTSKGLPVAAKWVVVRRFGHTPAGLITEIFRLSARYASAHECPGSAIGVLPRG